MADTPSRSHREVIDLDAEPDPPTPTPSHRPTPEVKSETDSDAASTSRVFARSRAPPVMNASLRKQMLLQQKKLFEEFKAAREAQSSSQGPLTREEILAAFGFDEGPASTSGTQGTGQTRRAVSFGGSSDISEADIDEEERGKRTEYRRKREEIIAPGVDPAELDDEDRVEVEQLDNVEKHRRRRLKEDLECEREADSTDEEHDNEADSLFIRRRNVGAQVSMAELLDDDHEIQNGDVQLSDIEEAESDADEPVAGPSGQGSGRRSGMLQFRHRRETGLNNLAFDPLNLRLDDSLPAQPAFGERRYASTAEALRALYQSSPADDRAALKGDIQSLHQAISWFRGQGRTVKPAQGLRGWHMRGFKKHATLKHYQVFGAGFMRKRERGDEAPHGGILADSMGLGKTWIAIAAIMDDHPLMIPRSKPRLTLIVASRAVADQWHEAFTLYCEERRIGKVYRYYGEGKKGIAKNDINAFKDFTIVLTTYYEMMDSWPHEEPPKELQLTEEQRYNWRLNLLDNHCGLLHRIKWRRVIIDEAQAIKNAKAHTSIAASKLQAEFRWLLTGTPFQNNLVEAFAYLRFLHKPGLPKFATWSRYYLVRKPKRKSSDISPRQQAKMDQDREKKDRRLRRALQGLMLRRVNTDVFLGGQILPLPENQSNTVFVDLGDFEMKVYRIVERRCQTIVKNMIDNHELRRSYTHLFKFLLILRQLTAHTLMIENAVREIFSMEDIQQLVKLAEAELGAAKDKQRQDNMITMRALLHEEQMQRLREQAGNRLSRTRSVVPLTDPEYTGDSYGDSFDFRPYLKDLMWGPKNSWKQYNDEMLCSRCGLKPEAPRITSCGHLHCTLCLHEMQIEAALEDQDRATCRQCDVAFGSTVPVVRQQYDEEVEDLPLHHLEDDEFEVGDSEAREKERAMNESWIGRDSGNIVPSAKTTAVKLQIVNWIRENPKVKILVYCQFLGVIKLLGRMCQIEGWDYVVYHGRMSHTIRAEAIKTFKTSPTVNIMIGTLKTGGTGLNLACASRLILVDLWWNLAIHAQAWGRIYRHGQESETRMTTFVVRQTVDEDMTAMQNYKANRIDSVMEDRSLNLSPKEMCMLFGFGRSAPMPENLDSSDVELEEGQATGSPDAASQERDVDN